MAVLAIIGLIFVSNWGHNTPPAHPQDQSSVISDGDARP